MDRTRATRFVLLSLAGLVAVTSISIASPQLIARMNVTAPSSWTFALLPRSAADADAAGPLTISPTLTGSGPTYLNWSTWKNAAVCGSWTDAIYVDGVPVQSVPRSDCDYVAKYFTAVNQGPVYIRGGRHTISAQADVYLNVCTDHSFPPGSADAQFVWSPVTLTRATVKGLNTPPPDRGWYGIPNSDAYELDRANDYAWVVAAISNYQPDDVDLIVYDDAYQGSSNPGLTHEVARSAHATGTTEFIVGGSTSGGPTSYFPAVIRGTSATGTIGYFLRWDDSDTRRSSDANAVWSSQTFGPYGQGLAEVYEVYLTAGVPTPMDLTRIGGTEDLSFAIFPSTPGGVWSRDQALATATPYQDQEYDAMTVTATQTGWYPLVVYRQGFDGSYPIYTLRVGPSATVAVEHGIPAALSFSLSSGNPARVGTRFRYGLPAAAPVRITILDAQGRRVRTVLDTRVDAGQHDAAWDLRDASGMSVGAGLYWARLESLGRTITRRLTVLR